MAGAALGFEDLRPGQEEAAAAARQAAHRAAERTRREMTARSLARRGAGGRSCSVDFGQPSGDRRGHCDDCVRDRPAPPRPAAGAGDPAPFPLDSRARHEAWGEGLVVGVDGGALAVAFDEAGYRTLSIDLVSANGLLRPA